METIETEVRFLEINKETLIQKLLSLGAHDEGEKMLEEVIIFDKELEWKEQNKFIRIRKSGDKTTMVYKEFMKDAKEGAKEVEFEVSDFDQAILFTEKLGFIPYRRQQKKRHTLQLKDVTFDIDTWPKIPSYVELEGPSMESLQEAAKLAELDWTKVVYKDARWVIENVYNIPVGNMRWFTFDKFE